MSMATTDIILANPRGFCAGVDRAIAIVERVLARFPAPVYVRHEVVHNRTVVNDLKAKGAVFIEDLAEVPNGAVVIFSAHGVSKQVRQEAQARQLQVFDATCPLVTKVHVEVAKMKKKGKRIIMIGHKGHPEVEGTMGQVEDINAPVLLIENEEDIKNLAATINQSDKSIAPNEGWGFVTQTTLSQDDTESLITHLKNHIPSIESPKQEDICYATQNRQEAVKALAATCDVVLVIGSPNSSNSNRLREVSQKAGCEAFLLDTAEELKPEMLRNKKKIGITAGASAPESLVKNLVQGIEAMLIAQGQKVCISSLPEKDEGMSFPLPQALN